MLKTERRGGNPSALVRHFVDKQPLCFYSIILNYPLLNIFSFLINSINELGFLKVFNPWSLSCQKRRNIEKNINLSEQNHYIRILLLGVLSLKTNYF